MKFQHLSYTTKIWLFSVLVSPILLGIFSLFDGISPPKTGIELFAITFGFYLLIILFGMLFSLPAYGIFILSNKFIFQNTNNRYLGKTLASLVGILICCLFYIVIFGDFNIWSADKGKRLFFHAYTSTIFLGAWYYEP